MHMDTQIKLQNQFINDLIKNKQTVSIFMINGIKLQGVIDEYDDATLVVKSMNSMLIYTKCYFYNCSGWCIGYLMVKKQR